MARIKTSDIFDIGWGLAQLEVRYEIRNWIKGAIRRQAGIPWRGGHDEGSYTCAWGNFYRLTGDETIKNFLNWLRDSYREWSKVHEYHGFQADARDHSNHSFENAEEFIVALCNMDPDDKVNAEIIEDVAHHVGNWVEGIPEWYDWKRHRFVSHWVGTRKVRNQPPDDFELAGHARIGTIVLQAYKITHNERYMDWCKDYAGKWVDTIMKSEDRIPMVTYGTELEPEERMRVYNSGREKVGDPYIGNLWPEITKHAVNFLLKVYEFVKDPAYLEAVRKAISMYEGRLNVNKMVDLYMFYHEVSGENIYQGKLVKWYEEYVKPELAVEQMVPNTLIVTKNRNRMYEPNIPRYTGVSRNFGYNDSKGNITMYQGPTPEMYLKGYLISGSLECLRRAMSLAANELFLVAYSTRDGREHGCEGHRFIHGMGEEAADTLYEATKINEFDYFKADGTFGLEEDVAVICDLEKEGDTPIFYFYNHNEAEKVIKIAPRGKGVHYSVEVAVKPRQVTRFEMKI